MRPSRRIPDHKHLIGDDAHVYWERRLVIAALEDVAHMYWELLQVADVVAALVSQQQHRSSEHQRTIPGVLQGGSPPMRRVDYLEPLDQN